MARDFTNPSASQPDERTGPTDDAMRDFGFATPWRQSEDAELERQRERKRQIPSPVVWGIVATLAASAWVLFAFQQSSSGRAGQPVSIETRQAAPEVLGDGTEAASTPPMPAQ